MAYDAKYVAAAMKKIRPTLELGIDYELADFGDGQGPRISAWHRVDVAQPTTQELEAVDTAVASVEEDDRTFDAMLKTNRVLRAFIAALNDGSMPIGQNKSLTFIRNVIKAKMNGA